MNPPLSFPASVATTDTALPVVLRVRRPQVLHQNQTALAVALTAPNLLRRNVSRGLVLVAQQRQSTDCATTVLIPGDRPTPVAITSPHRMVRAVMSAPDVVTKSGVNSSLPASKAIVTFAGPWFTRHPSEQERATTGALTTVSSDGLIAYRFMERTAYRLTCSQPIPLPGAGALLHRRGTPTPIIPRQFAGRLMNQPQGENNAVAQTETLTYRLAEHARTLRRSHLRLASRDGVIDPEEAAIDAGLLHLVDDLEQKADDERAAIALLRTGRTKRTRGIVVDLFPSIGPEAA